MKLTTFLLTLTGASALLARRSKDPAPYTTCDKAELVKDTYIVRFHDGHTLENHFEAIGQNLSETSSMFYYMNLLNGYHAELSSQIVHDLVRYDPGVRLVEHDHYTAADTEDDDEEIDIPPPPPPAPTSPSLLRRWGWAQKRIIGTYYHQGMIARGEIVDPSLLYPWTYTDQIKGAGAGVNVYIMDTGVRISHDWFEGRATNFQGKTITPYIGGNTAMDDTDGHGTHVAGIVAAFWYGAAPSANIVNVKVRISKTAGGLVGGAARAINDIVNEHIANQANPPPGWRGSVINISLRLLDPTETIRDAMVLANKAGIPITVAAGNGVLNKQINRFVGIPSDNALCGYPTSLCVAACDRNYSKAEFSNYGSSVGIIAPGVDIVSAGIRDDWSRALKSGTSMAAPAVAGTLAIFISFEGIDNNVKAVLSRMTSNMLTKAVKGFDSTTTPNLVQTGINNYWKDPTVPYYGAPGREFKLANAKPVEDDSGDATDVPASTLGPPAAASATTEAILSFIPSAVPTDATATASVVVPIETMTDGGSLTTGAIISAPTDAAGNVGFEGDLEDLDADNSTSSASPTTSSAAPTATLCSGNQVEGPCIAGSLPSSAPYSGVQPPSCDKADGGAGAPPRINAQAASDAASAFCDELISNGAVLSAQNSDYAPYEKAGSAENGKTMALIVMYDVSACPVDKSKTTADMKALGKDECYANMYTALSEVCEQDSTWTNYNKDFTMMGGVFPNDCAIWSISAN